MKNKFTLLALASFLLVGCGGQSINHQLSFKVLTPNGAPAVAMYNFATDIDHWETNAKPTNIVALMTENSEFDVVVVDTTSGIKAIENGSPYKMAATITLGNFFIASTGNDDNEEMGADDTIVLFGNENAVPAKIFHYLYGTTYDAAIEYVSAVSDAAKCLITGSNLGTGHSVDYVFIAQPVLYKALASNTHASVYKDIQKEYKNKSGNLPLMQASVFVKNSANTDDVDTFLYTLKKDIAAGINDPSLIKAGIEAMNDTDLATTRFGVDSETVYAVMQANGLGLGYLPSYENKTSVDAYVNLFGMEQTSEEIYYK